MIIRCSTLPSYNDCPRRTAATAWRAMVADRGYTLRKLPNSIGAAVGTGAHEAARVACQAIINGTTPDIGDAIEQGIASLRKRISEDGAEYDDTTASRNIAEQQVRQLSNSFAVEILPEIKPARVETFRPADIGDGFKLTGHTDIETVDNFIDDEKYGAKYRPCHAQIGGYSLTKKSHEGKQPAGGRVRFMPRVSPKKIYPGAMTFVYDLDFCESEAWNIIQRIKRDIQLFNKTGLSHAFPANPMSMMCSDKYCPAWGTDFCKYKEEA